jgi:phosphoribosylformylglycinamidine (FGAM) synthase-like amidotransferase family enzyme
VLKKQYVSILMLLRVILERKGYLVYTVRIMDCNSNSHKVIVDHGNGRTLFDQSIFDDQEEHSNSNVLYQYHDHHHDDNE